MTNSFLKTLKSVSVCVPKEDRKMFDFDDEIVKSPQKNNFDFTAYPDPRTSQGRYQRRVHMFKIDGKSFSRIRHGFWWVLHNCVAHPLLGILPFSKTFQFHDWTSNKLNHK